MTARVQQGERTPEHVYLDRFTVLFAILCVIGGAGGGSAWLLLGWLPWLLANAFRPVGTASVFPWLWFMLGAFALGAAWAT